MSDEEDFRLTTQRYIESIKPVWIEYRRPDTPHHSDGDHEERSSSSEEAEDLPPPNLVEYVNKIVRTSYEEKYAVPSKNENIADAALDSEASSKDLEDPPKELEGACKETEGPPKEQENPPNQSKPIIFDYDCEDLPLPEYDEENMYLEENPGSPRSRSSLSTVLDGSDEGYESPPLKLRVEEEEDEELYSEDNVYPVQEQEQRDPVEQLPIDLVLAHDEKRDLGDQLILETGTVPGDLKSDPVHQLSLDLAMVQQTDPVDQLIIDPILDQPDFSDEGHPLDDLLKEDTLSEIYKIISDEKPLKLQTEDMIECVVPVAGSSSGAREATVTIQLRKKADVLDEMDASCQLGVPGLLDDVVPAVNKSNVQDLSEELLNNVIQLRKKADVLDEMDASCQLGVPGLLDDVVPAVNKSNVQDLSEELLNNVLQHQEKLESIVPLAGTSSGSKAASSVFLPHTQFESWTPEPIINVADVKPNRTKSTLEQQEMSECIVPVAGSSNAPKAATCTFRPLIQLESRTPEPNINVADVQHSWTKFTEKGDGDSLVNSNKHQKWVLNHPDSKRRLRKRKCATGDVSNGPVTKNNSDLLEDRIGTSTSGIGTCMQTNTVENTLPEKKRKLTTIESAIQLHNIKPCIVLVEQLELTSHHAPAKKILPPRTKKDDVSRKEHEPKEKDSLQLQKMVKPCAVPLRRVNFPSSSSSHRTT